MSEGQNKNKKIIIIIIVCVIVISTSLLILLFLNNSDENNEVTDVSKLEYKVNDGKIGLSNFKAQYDEEKKTWILFIKITKKSNDDCDYSKYYMYFYDKDNNYLGVTSCFFLTMVTKKSETYSIPISFDGSKLDHIEIMDANKHSIIVNEKD